MQPIARDLREWRRSRQVDAAEFARAIGEQVSGLYRLEWGLRRASRAEAQRIKAVMQEYEQGKRGRV